MESQFYTLNTAGAPDYTRSFPDHLRSQFAQYENEARWQRTREIYILNGLAALAKTLETSRPAGSAPAKILLEYGAAHTGLMRAVAGPDTKIHERLPINPTYFSNRDEAVRRHWLALDPTVKRAIPIPDANLASAAVAEDLLMNWFFWPNVSRFQNTAELVSWFRSVAAKFSAQDVAELWEYQRTARLTTRLPSSTPLPELKNILAAKLREKKVDEKYIHSGLASEQAPFEKIVALRTPQYGKSLQTTVA